MHASVRKSIEEGLKHQSSLRSLDAFVEQLSDTAQEELADEIEARRAELSDGSLTVADATISEILDARPELREYVADSDEDDEDVEPEGADADDSERVQELEAKVDQLVAQIETLQSDDADEANEEEDEDTDEAGEADKADEADDGEEEIEDAGDEDAGEEDSDEDEDAGEELVESKDALLETAQQLGVKDAEDMDIATLAVAVRDSVSHLPSDVKATKKKRKRSFNDLLRSA
jgi:hypothetical protein